MVDNLLLLNEALYEVNKTEAGGIGLQQIDKHTTQMAMFPQGKLEAVGLSRDDMTKYGTSDYVYYTPTSKSYNIGRMIGPGETRCLELAPKGNAKTLRQKGRTMTNLRRVRLAARRRCNLCGRVCRFHGISQVRKRRHKASLGALCLFSVSSRISSQDVCISKQALGGRTT